MNQMKWLMISLGLAFAASVGMVGCGDDEKTACTSNDDCDDSQVCSVQTGKCEETCDGNDDCDTEAGERCSNGCTATVPFCFVPCQVDSNCDDGDVCDTSFCPGGSTGLCVPASELSCTSNNDCDTATQVCDTVSGTCVAKCESNADCDLGLVCNANTKICQPASAACTTNNDCGVGETCNANKCTPGAANTCDEQQDCYDKGGDQFCAATQPMTCVDTSCGVAFNSCSRCNLGPNGGSRATDGPSIFAASQVNIGSASRNCTNNLTFCLADAPILCEFKFFAFSPNDADLPTSDLNKKVFVISGSGKSSTTFGVKRGTENGLTTFSFRACFPEGGGNSVGTAAFLESVSGKRSNTLCMNGTK